MMLLILMVSIIILTVFIYSIFVLPKKLGYHKIGKILSLIVIITLSIVILYVCFEDKLFVKSKTLKNLNENNIILVDNFEVIINRSRRFDYHLITKVKISENDKEKLIAEIKKTKGFQIKENGNLNFENEYKLIIKDRTFMNYKSDDNYIRKSYIKEINSVPVFDIISINENDNVLIFKRFVD